MESKLTFGPLKYVYMNAIDEKDHLGMTQDPIEIYKSVLNNRLTFPSFVQDIYFKVVSNFYKTSSRLTSFSSIKKEEWLNDFDWKSLASFTCVSPYNHLLMILILHVISLIIMIKFRI